MGLLGDCVDRARHALADRIDPVTSGIVDIPFSDALRDAVNALVEDEKPHLMFSIPTGKVEISGSDESAARE